MKKKGIIITIVLVVLFLALLGNCAGESSNVKTCKVCHRSFSDSSNKRSIALTNMCENCYANFKWGMDATGKW